MLIDWLESASPNKKQGPKGPFFVYKKMIRDPIVDIYNQIDTALSDGNIEFNFIYEEDDNENILIMLTSLMEYHPNIKSVTRIIPFGNEWRVKL